MKKKTIVILGAGATGLVAAYYLAGNYNVIILEKLGRIGGMSYSFKHKGFTLDYGPHKIYTQIPGVMEEINKACPLIRIKKKNSVYLQGNLFDFPLSIKQVAVKMPLVGINAGLDIFLKKINKREENCYENFLMNNFGTTLYNLVFRDYAEKVWGNPKELDVELAKRRVAVSGIVELIKSTLLKKSGKISADFFYYPENGSYQLYDSLAEKIKKNGGRILLGCKLKKINIEGRKAVSIIARNSKIKVDFIISTIPLDSLAGLMAVPAEVSDAIQNLEYRDLYIIYFILKKERALKDSWIFFPESRFLFNRVSEQKSFSPLTCPKDKTALMVETTKETSNEVIGIIKQQLIDIGILSESEIEEIFVKRLFRAYPIYKKDFEKNLNIALSHLDSIENLITIGRFGLFNYNNIDQCWDMALKVARHIENSGSFEDWKKIRESFDEYKIVD